MKFGADLAVLLFVVSSLLSVGLSLSVGQVLTPLQRWRSVVLAVVTNFVIVPAAAILIARCLSLSQPYSIGLILVGTTAGAPFLPKLLELAKGDVAFSVALMVFLMACSLVYLPLVLPRLLAGVSVDSWRIARSLFTTMLVPLAFGLMVHARYPQAAARWAPRMNRLSNTSLAAALILIPAANSGRFAGAIELAAVLACAMLVVVAFVAGYALGGSVRLTREVIGFGSAARNAPVALLIGGQNFEDPRVGFMAVVVALMSLALLAPLAAGIARLNR
ncbi:MAG: bile acid:sodium symporter family protein [Pirellulaceae bacterium]